MPVTALVPLTATGNVGGPNGGQLYGITIMAAAATGTVIVREGGSGGTVILNLSVAATTSHHAGFYGAAYSGQLHATLAGTGALVTFELG